MSCKFIWYNLPNQINKIIKPFTTTKVYWYNMPNTLTRVYKELLLLKPTCPQAPKFQWYALNKKAEAICELVDCLSAAPQFNFDVTSTNWDTIVDAASFKAYLEAQNGETTNTITNFSLVGGRLQCNISGITDMLLDNLHITDVNYITVVGLQILDLSGNQIVIFNPSIALPTSLQNLYLGGNQIVIFNPTIALPSGLINLYLGGNQIVIFNPSIALPTSLQNLYLFSNQMTLLGYTNSEPWANSLSVSIGKQINLSFNINNSNGTNFVTILQSKGWTVNT